MKTIIQCGVCVVGVTLAIGAFAAPGHGQCEIPKHPDVIGSEFELLAMSVAIEGDVVVAGGPHYPHLDQIPPGDARIYWFNDGSGQWELDEIVQTPGGPIEEDRFGWACAISNGRVLIGAPGDSPYGANAGRAHIFENDGQSWNGVPIGNEFIIDGGDRFGASVSISGDTVVVGSPYADEGNNDAGAVDVFTLEGGDWEYQQTILATFPLTGDDFGSAVAIDGDVLAVGDPGRDMSGEDAGRVYIYRYNGSTWEYEDGMSPPPQSDDFNFGAAVAVEGDVLLIGAPGAAANHGAVYAYRYDNGDWNEEAQLVADDGAENDRFGNAVALSTELAVIGATGADAAYLFSSSEGTWSQQAKFKDAEHRTGESFGHSVALRGDHAIVGAPFFGLESYWGGAAYVFGGLGDCNENGVVDVCDIIEGDSEDCNGNSVPDECDIADGTSEDCQPNGIPDECELGVEIVFIVDTSGSMDDETDLCEDINSVISELSDQIPSVHAKMLGVKYFSTHSFDCLEGYVFDVYGEDVPGEPEYFEVLDHEEDWGPAISIVADAPWSSAGMRFIVPISDEGPCEGTANNNDCNADDSGSLDHAKIIADQNDVIFLPVKGKGIHTCVVPLMEELVDGTEGEVFQSPGFGQAMAQKIIDVLDTAGVDCNKNDIPDECDIANGTSEDWNENGIPDECECPADLDHDWDVDTSDLLQLLGCWGTPCGDVDFDGDTDTADLLALLAAWGSCDGLGGSIPRNVQDCIDKFGFGDPEALEACIQAVTGGFD